MGYPLFYSKSKSHDFDLGELRLFFFSYFFHVLMTLMRGPQQEEAVAEEKEEKVSHLRVLPALPAAAEEPSTQLQAIGADASKEENGQ